MAGRQVPCTARVVALDSVACGPVYTRGPFAVSTRGQRESLSQRARSSYTPPRGALSTLLSGPLPHCCPACVHLALLSAALA